MRRQSRSSGENCCAVTHFRRHNGGAFPAYCVPGYLLAFASEKGAFLTAFVRHFWVPLNIIAVAFRGVPAVSVAVDLRQSAELRREHLICHRLAALNQARFIRPVIRFGIVQRLQVVPDQ
jgi:hypothetical protein